MAGPDSKIRSYSPVCDVGRQIRGAGHVVELFEAWLSLHLGFTNTPADEALLPALLTCRRKQPPSPSPPPYCVSPLCRGETLKSFFYCTVAVASMACCGHKSVAGLPGWFCTSMPLWVCPKFTASLLTSIDSIVTPHPTTGSMPENL